MVTDPRRASREELARWHTRMAKWSRPARFRLIVEHMRRAHGTHNLDQPGSLFRDAFVAARCARLAHADAVRLGADPPDFELRLSDQIHSFEVVEAAAPGRMRGLELRAERMMSGAERAKPVHIPGEEWTGADQALAQVGVTVARKRNHRYAAGTILVVYLNIWPVAGREKLIAGLGQAVSSALAGFAGVWVLDGDQLRKFGPD